MTDLAPAARDALAALLLTVADDELVIGYWDSEWTGIAPMLEEDVAMSSVSQDEIGHAAALYAMLGELTGRDPDDLAYAREPDAFRHAALLDHPRTDWAFTIARRYLYETADAARLEALAASSHEPLAQLAAKMRREERYHLMHVDAWLRRLAAADGEGRERLVQALAQLGPDALTVLGDPEDEAILLAAGILPEPMAAVRGRWLERIAGPLGELGLPVPSGEPRADGRHSHGADFAWLHGEMTMVSRSEVGATW
jgi:ring-1,2-phenylacetyl-CoA epoxidase subunit PaaC